MRKVFTYKNYIIFKSYSSNYVLYNYLKPFEEGHTHLNDVRIARRLIYLEINRQIPNDLSDYLLISLKRITRDKGYKRRVDQELIRRGKIRDENSRE